MMARVLQTRGMARPLLAALLALLAATAQATGLQQLEAFIKTVRSGKAEFTQVVTSPPREGQAPRSKTSGGSFEFVRPQKFRFDYRKPFEQRIVADGQTLWLHDLDLNQVSARKQASVLGSTPAALLASASDIKTLQDDFTLSDAPDEGGLEWVLAVPRNRDSTLQSVRLGFRGKLPEVLEIVDSFGQKSVLGFKGFEANPAIAASRFQFQPPAGADVIRN